MKLQERPFSVQGYFWGSPSPILSISSTQSVWCSLVPIPMPACWQATCCLNQCVRRSSSTCSRKSGRICTLESSGLVMKVGHGVLETLFCVTFSLRQLTFTLNGPWYKASTQSFSRHVEVT